MKQAHAGWISLSAAERMQWQQFTSYSSPKIRHDKKIVMSGHSLYLKYQVSRLIAGLSIKDTLQYIAFPEWYYPTAVYLEDPVLYLETDAPDETEIEDMFIISLCTSPRAASRKFYPQGLRYCRTAGDDWDSLNFQTSYVANFGSLPPLGSVLHYSFQVFSSLTPIFSNVRTGTLNVTIIP
jgi:hypothetical protein